MNLWGVQANQLEAIRPHVEETLSAALVGAGMGTNDLFDRLESEAMQLWIVWDETADFSPRAAVVTEIVDRPRDKCMRIFLCTGTGREEWQGYVSTLEAWAKSKGCGRVMAWARPGWERVLTDYKRTHVLLEKELEHVY